ncbi:MAG: hypothetical protein R3247_05565 [Rhodothermales bacterium]|nr:hypothetical protein [Rhodothermales bacterium]
MNPVNRIPTLAALVFGVLFLVSTAHAQTPMPDATVENVPVWVEHLGEQLSQELDSPAEAIRHQALQHIAYFASFYGDRLDLKPVLPHLIEIYTQDDSEQCRLLAVAAIHAIGDNTAMQEVRRLNGLLEEPSMRVQLVTLAALADFYGVETFAGERDVTRLARALFDYYTEPRVIVHPPVVIPPDSNR